MEAVPHARSRALLAGLGAGLVLAGADCAATGLALLPPSLALASLLLGAALGSGAGSLAAAFRRPTLGPALVLAIGIGLEGLSIASKELDGTARVLGALLVVGAALAGFACVFRLRPGTADFWALAGVVASLPAGAYLAARLTDEPWGHLAGASFPLVLLVLGRASAGRTSFLRAVLPALVLLAAIALERSPPPRPDLPRADVPPASGPNLVLLVIDTLRADALAPEGALARFAQQGTDFRQCVSAAPWTLPALGSLLTGLYPSQHGALTAMTPLADEVSTLAELLHARGYATAAFTGGAFVGAAHRLDQGFEHFDASCERRFALGTHAPLVWRLAKNRYLPLLWLVRWVDEVRGFEGVVAAAREWGAEREEARDERPFFLFLHTYQVHDYYLYDPPIDDGQRERGPEFSARFAGRLSVHPSELLTASQADLDVFRSLYEGRIRALEERIPELERWVNELAGEDGDKDGGKDIVWVVTADHGEGFDAARARVHHGGRLHDDLLRVPLLLRAEGRIPVGRVIEEAVRSVDLLPTALDLLGLPIPTGLAGESLLPAVLGARPFPSSAFAEERAHGAELLALRRDGWKCIRGPSHSELYRLSVDPHETVALTDAPPGELASEILSFPALFPARASSAVEIDAATLEHLRALGYVR